MLSALRPIGRHLRRLREVGSSRATSTLGLVRGVRAPAIPAPKGGWGGPVAVVSSGLVVAAMTALPAVGLDGHTASVNALARVGDEIGVAAALGAQQDDGVVEVAAGGDELARPRSTSTVAIGTAASSTTVSTSPPRTDATSLASNGIPDKTLRAYQAAAAALGSADPSCRIDWTLLAGIGRVESNHGRFAGAIVSTEGVSIPAVVGIRLDGSVEGTKVIVDSDGGRLDNDGAYDRAVGPMQFLPGSWVAFGADGDGDGARNPQDIDDAALAAAAFLCSGNDDLSTVPGASAAVRRYNNSGEYVTLVLKLADAYRGLVPIGAILTVPAVSAVPVTAQTPIRPAAPEVVLGLPEQPSVTTTGTSTSESSTPQNSSTDSSATDGSSTDPSASTTSTTSSTTDSIEVPPTRPPSSTSTTTPGTTTSTTGTTTTSSSTTATTGATTGTTAAPTTSGSPSTTAPTATAPTTTAPTATAPTTTAPTAPVTVPTPTTPSSSSAAEVPPSTAPTSTPDPPTTPPAPVTTVPAAPAPTTTASVPTTSSEVPPSSP